MQKIIVSPLSSSKCKVVIYFLFYLVLIKTLRLSALAGVSVMEEVCSRHVVCLTIALFHIYGLA